MRDLHRSAAVRRERMLASPQFADGRFRNVPGARMDGVSLPVVGEFIFRRARRVPAAPLPLERPRWGSAADSGLRVTWLGHSTLLLELDGRRVLTDPVFGQRASPVGFAGPRRFHPPPVALAGLPPLDAVVLSHDHYDHLCRATMAELARSDVPIVTALGVGGHLERFGVPPGRITELDWSERAELPGLLLTAVPAQHFSGRSLIGRDRTLWASWVIESERRKVFFSGDTGLHPGFAAIGAAHGPFDLVMLEIGGFHPSWGTIHLGPDNALTAFDALGRGTLLPVHWGTFNLALHDWDEPVETLLASGTARGARIITPRIGEVIEPHQLDGPRPWWRNLEARLGDLVTA